MGGSPVPATIRRRPWLVRAARRLGAIGMRAVFGFGVVTSLGLVVLGALLFFGLGMTTGGVALAIAGVIVGLGYAVAQGAVG